MNQGTILKLSWNLWRQGAVTEMVGAKPGNRQQTCAQLDAVFQYWLFEKDTSTTSLHPTSGKAKGFGPCCEFDQGWAKAQHMD